MNRIATLILLSASVTLLVPPVLAQATSSAPDRAVAAGVHSINLSSVSFVLLAPPVLGQAAASAPDQAVAAGADFSDLAAFSDLRTAFERDTGKVRLVTLLSPSCGYCIKGYRYVRKILEEVPDPRLRVYVAWEPMLSGDTRELAEKMAKKATDPRFVFQAWDGDRLTGDAWTAAMLAGDDRFHSTGPAWDVYFLYTGDAVWAGDAPSVPSYWQHQGAGSGELVLNYDRLKENVEGLLRRLDDHTTATTGGE